ncbi:glutathione S-transferase [Exophiala viscosa]|uniref:glutathione S-transferase n=1 Tax=Exophiala viscosa TaxID=2486360 RepID=UPI00218D462F|nr:glutathione S-transferase [Exophiala viscosa]
MSSSPPYNKLSYYTFGTPNGLKPALILEELGLKYDSHQVNIMKNEQKEPWFLDINPNGRIPALKDGDLRVFESGAIMLYLTDMYDKEKKFTYEYGTDLYYEMLSWVMFQMGGIGPMQGQANHFRLMAPVYDTYGMKRYIDETKRLISVLEIRLSKADWLAGDKYTIADMASWAWVKGAPSVDIDMSEFPGVERWIKRIAERPATEKAKTATGALPDDKMKEMFDGMKAKMDAKKDEAK